MKTVCARSSCNYLSDTEMEEDLKEPKAERDRMNRHGEKRRSKRNQNKRGRMFLCDKFLKIFC